MPQVSELHWSIFIFHPFLLFFMFFVLSFFFQNYKYMGFKINFMKSFNFLIF